MDEMVSKSQRSWKSRERGPGSCSPRWVPCHLQRGQGDTLRGEPLGLFLCMWGTRHGDTRPHSGQLKPWASLLSRGLEGLAGGHRPAGTLVAMWRLASVARH